MADEKDGPITWGQILKWSGIVGSLVTGIIGVVWFAASVKADNQAQQNNLASAVLKLDAEDMRKLRTILNAMVKNKTPWKEAATCV